MTDEQVSRLEAAIRRDVLEDCEIINHARRDIVYLLAVVDAQRLLIEQLKSKIINTK